MTPSHLLFHPPAGAPAKGNQGSAGQTPSALGSLRAHKKPREECPRVRQIIPEGSRSRQPGSSHLQARYWLDASQEHARRSLLFLDCSSIGARLVLSSSRCPHQGRRWEFDPCARRAESLGIRRPALGHHSNTSLSCHPIPFLRSSSPASGHSGYSELSVLPLTRYRLSGWARRSSSYHTGHGARCPGCFPGQIRRDP